MVSFSKHGMPKDLDMLEKMIAIFTVRNLNLLL